MMLLVNRYLCQRDLPRLQLQVRIIHESGCHAASGEQQAEQERNACESA